MINIFDGDSAIFIFDVDWKSNKKCESDDRNIDYNWDDSYYCDFLKNSDIFFEDED